MTALEREGGKQSHLPLSGTCSARTWRLPCTHLGLCRQERGPETRGAPRQSTGPAAPVPCDRSARTAGKTGGPERRCASHAAPGCGGRSHPAEGPCAGVSDSETLGGDKRRGAGAQGARRAPQRLFPPPSAAGWVCARLCAGISVAPHDTPSSSGGSAPPPTHGLRRAPRATRRLCRVSSGGSGDAPSHVSRPRSGERRGSGRRKEAHGRARRPCSTSSRPLALQASPASSASARLRLSLSRLPAPRPASLPPPPSSGPAGPSARPNPCAPAFGRRRAQPAHLRRRWRPSRQTPRQHLPAPPSASPGWEPPARREPGKRLGGTGGTARPWPAGPS